MNMRTIVLVLGIFALLSTAAGGYLQYHTAQESALKQAERELFGTGEALKENVLDLISLNQSQARVLAKFEQIPQALLKQNPEALLEANRILDHFAENLAYDVGYLMDSSGNTIASSNRNQLDSFVGQNYSFRRYFIEAIQGRPGIYLAVGVTSGIRGIYFSHPVYRADGSRPIGVVVIKVSPQDLDSELSHVRAGTELLVHDSGMIFVSSREDWALNLLWRVLPQELAQIEKTQQFGKGPWNWTGLERRGDNHAVDGSGEEYLVHEMSLENCPGWRLVSLYSAKVISGRFVDPLVGKTGYLALASCFLVGGAVIVLYVMAQKDIRNRKWAEEALKTEKGRFEVLAQNSPFGMVIIQPDGTFSYVNPKFQEMFGYDLRDVPNGREWFRKAYPDPDYRHEVISTWMEEVKASALGETRPKVFSVTCKDGRKKIVQFRPVKLDSGEDLTTCEDITDIKTVEEEIRRTKALLDSIIQNLPTAVFLKDAEELRFALWNKTCEELYGHKADDVLGKTSIDVFLGSDASRFESQDREVLKSGRLMEIPDQFVTTRYKGLRILHTKKIPLIGEDGRPSHLLGISEDITARKTTEQELFQAKTDAERASRTKSEFLANMSHEIRTPMNGVIGMTDLALGTELNDEQREYLEAVRISADSLLTLINDILDFAKIEAGKLELVPMDFSLRDCVANTLITLAASAHKKGLELIYDIPAQIPDAVIGDPGRLRQILVNLVGNAVKFTEKGEVAVGIHLESENDPEICLRFTVTDTGIGIPPEKQEKIFDAFEQADGSTTRQYGGTGLGLAVSTQLVHMMGGTILVESEVGRGSTFRFTVRLGVQTEPTGMSICVESSSLKNLPVLVVDDNATNRRVLEQMLASWHMKPVSVDHAAGALDEMKRAHDRGTPFALVLVDYMMPDIDGFQLAEQIKGDPVLSESVLVMLTSAGERGHAAKCVELGIAGYLMKPVRQSELFEIICSSMQKSGPGKARTSLLTRHAIRESKLRLNILLAEDNPVNQKLATRLLQKMGHSVTVVENGRKALAAFMKDQFDVILMDIQMPEMDGFEATAAIREREKSQDGTHVPILAMTAHAMAGDRERCLEGGMDGYVSKPINVQELAEALENLPTRDQVID